MAGRAFSCLRRGPGLATPSPNTLADSGRIDTQAADQRPTVAYPGPASLIPVQARDEFVAGMQETRCAG
jgi:hypothetical protein